MRPPSDAPDRSPCSTRAHCRLVGTAISGMAEEASGIVPGDGSQGGAEGGVDAFDGAGRGFAQQAFDLGPGRLDRVQFRRVAPGAATSCGQKGAGGPI
jgi:hypothetical protein